MLKIKFLILLKKILVSLISALECAVKVITGKEIGGGNGDLPQRRHALTSPPNCAVRYDGKNRIWELAY